MLENLTTTDTNQFVRWASARSPGSTRSGSGCGSGCGGGGGEGVGSRDQKVTLVLTALHHHSLGQT